MGGAGGAGSVLLGVCRMVPFAVDSVPVEGGWAVLGVDPPGTPLYSRSMVDWKKPTGPVDMVGLEMAVEALLDHCEHLRTDNAALRLQLARLAAEREVVEKAKKLARDRVAAVVSRLKALEK